MQSAGRREKLTASPINSVGRVARARLRRVHLTTGAALRSQGLVTLTCAMAIGTPAIPTGVPATALTTPRWRWRSELERHRLSAYPAEVHHTARANSHRQGIAEVRAQAAELHFDVCLRSITILPVPFTVQVMAVNSRMRSSLRGIASWPAHQCRLTRARAAADVDDSRHSSLLVGKRERWRWLTDADADDVVRAVGGTTPWAYSCLLEGLRALGVAQSA